MGNSADSQGREDGIRLVRIEAISKLSFRTISASGPRFQSSKYSSIPAAENSGPP